MLGKCCTSSHPASSLTASCVPSDSDMAEAQSPALASAATEDTRATSASNKAPDTVKAATAADRTSKSKRLRIRENIIRARSVSLGIESVLCIFPTNSQTRLCCQPDHFTLPHLAAWPDHKLQRARTLLCAYPSRMPPYPQPEALNILLFHPKNSTRLHLHHLPTFTPNLSTLTSHTKLGLHSSSPSLFGL